MNRIRLGLLSVVFVAGFASASLAANPGSRKAGPEKCGIFSVYIDASTRKVNYVDHAPGGKSIGDQRIGYLAVKDKSGRPVGEHRWIATVVDVAQEPGQKDQTSSQGVFVFPSGTIFIARPAAPTFQSPENIAKISGRGNYIVTGGSGVFQGVAGIVERTGDLSTPFTFNISCV